MFSWWQKDSEKKKRETLSLSDRNKKRMGNELWLRNQKKQSLSSKYYHIIINIFVLRLLRSDCFFLPFRLDPLFVINAVLDISDSLNHSRSHRMNELVALLNHSWIQHGDNSYLKQSTLDRKE